MGILLIKLINGLAWGKMTGNNDFDTPFPRGSPAIFPSNHFLVQSLHLDCCFNDFSSIPFYQYQGGEVNVDNAQLFNGQAPLQSRCSWSTSSPQIGEMCSSSCGNLNGGNQLWPGSPLLCSHPYELLCITTCLCLKIDCQENSLMVNHHFHHGSWPVYGYPPVFRRAQIYWSKIRLYPRILFMSHLLIHNTKQARYNNMQSYESYVIIINHTFSTVCWLLNYYWSGAKRSEWGNDPCHH